MRERTLLILALALLAASLLPAAGLSAQPSTAPATQAARPAVVITVDGPINDYTRDRLFRRFDTARALGADTVVLRIDTYGGLVTASLDISRFLKRQDDLRVIAYVDDKAISAGAMIALACDEIVMEPGSTLGNAAPIAVSSAGALMPLGAAERAKAESPILADFRDSARRNGYETLLAEAMVTVGRVVHWVEGPGGQRRFVTDHEYERLVREGWKPVEGVDNPVDASDALLTVPSHLAVKLGLASGEAPSAAALAAQRGLRIVADLSPGAGEKLVELVGGTAARTLLLIVFLLALWVALHTPGHGAAEAVALVAGGLLVGVPLLTGYAQWWEIVLIILGLALLAVELFVTPGFGVMGVSGIALLLVGLILTFVGNAPGYPEMWKLPALQQGLRTGLAAVVSGLLASLVLAAWLKRYLPKLPYFNRLILTATAGGPGPGGAAGTVPAPLHDPNDVWPFAGTVGVATTPLHPGGTAEFPYADDRRVTAVVSDGGYVEPGTKVTVREARGNRVVVRPLV